MGNSSISLWNLPKDIVYLELEPKVKQKIFSHSLSYAGSWNKLAKSLNLKLNKYGECKILESSRKKKISLRVLKLLLAFLEDQDEIINYKRIEKSVILLAPKHGSSLPKANCLFNPKLPFNFNNKSGAIVVSALLHDGGIDSKFHPHYSNPLDPKLRRKVYKAFKDVFGEFKFERSNPDKHGQIYFPKIIGTILVYGLGMKNGRKVTNDVDIPKFIFDANREVRASFLRQAFDDEAHVHHTQRNISLKLASSKNGPSKLLTDLKRLLETFSIKSSNYMYAGNHKDKTGLETTKWTFCITGQKNLKKFLEDIGFESSHKNFRLQEIVNTLKQEHFTLDEKPKILMDSCNALQKKIGYITSRDLANVLNRSQPLAKIEIRRLRERGVLTVLKPKLGSSGARYVMVNS